MIRVDVDNLPSRPKASVDQAQLEILRSIASKRYSSETWTVGFPDGSGKPNSSQGGYILAKDYSDTRLVVVGGEIDGRCVGVLKEDDAVFMAAFDPPTVKHLLETLDNLLTYVEEVESQKKEAAQRHLIGANASSTPPEKADDDPF